MSSTNNNIFQFKQFAVDQSGCGMKVNTDGVLLGALARPDNPARILDIGTGTGVIALMLAQRFPEANVKAVEIEEQAASTAQKNFHASKFADRLEVHHQSFQDYSRLNAESRFDLIVSNPPFFTNSLKNPDKQKELARHSSDRLFEELVGFVANHLNENGLCYLILPVDKANQVIDSLLTYNMYPNHMVDVRSSIHKAPHRQIIAVSFRKTNIQKETFVIYETEKVYSNQYKTTLTPFLTIF